MSFDPDENTGDCVVRYEDADNGLNNRLGHGSADGPGTSFGLQSVVATDDSDKHGEENAFGHALGQILQGNASP